jgi:hypothetical protein
MPFAPFFLCSNIFCFGKGMLSSYTTNLKKIIKRQFQPKDYWRLI